MKGEIVEEIRLSVVKRKRSRRPWQSCDPNSVTSSSFASSLDMTALPISGHQRGSMGTVVCQTDPPWPSSPPSTSITEPLARLALLHTCELRLATNMEPAWAWIKTTRLAMCNKSTRICPLINMNTMSQC